MNGSYFHKVQYYETDSMGIVHHSNHLRWFEEARMDCLEKSGFGYETFEERGISIPVVSASCKYLVPVRFGETVRVDYELTEFRKIRFKISYKIFSGDGTTLHAEGETAHCFLNRELRPVSIKREYADLYEFFLSDFKEGQGEK